MICTTSIHKRINCGYNSSSIEIELTFAGQEMCQQFIATLYYSYMLYIHFSVILGGRVNIATQNIYYLSLTTKLGRFFSHYCGKRGLASAAYYCYIHIC